MAGVPLMVVDGAGVMLRWSSQAETLLGRPADEVVGRSVTSLLSRLADATAPATGPLPEEMVLHDAGGRVATGDLRVRPLLRHDGVAGLPDGPPLGSAEGPPFAQGTLPLAESSVLAFHTNSLLPGYRAVLPGDPGPLGQGLTASGRPLEEICDDVLYRLHDHPRPGDRVLLLARTHGLAADHVGTWHLDHHRSAAGTARAHAQRRLSAWEVDDDTAYATEVIVSELVTNAVRYGAPPLLLRIIKDRALTCEVHDSSSSAPHLRHGRTVDEGGRGLFICSQLAQRWGTRYSADGKTVWTEQVLKPRPDSRTG